MQALHSASCSARSRCCDPLGCPASSQFAGCGHEAKNRRGLRGRVRQRRATGTHHARLRLAVAADCDHAFERRARYYATLSQFDAAKASNAEPVPHRRPRNPGFLRYLLDP